jgi:tetratricopeptide (TPR) repeat protein
MSIESTESAPESCRRFLESDANPEAKAFFCLSAGIEKERQRDYEAALACYSLAFGLTPGQDDVWYFLHNNLGFCLNQFAKCAEAEPYCLQAIEINPHRHNAYKNLGVSLQGQGEYIAAAHLYLRAAEIAPEDPRAQQHLDALLRDQPEIGTQIRDIRLELAIEPTTELTRLTRQQVRALLLTLLDRCNTRTGSADAGIDPTPDSAAPTEEGQ